MNWKFWEEQPSKVQEYPKGSFLLATTLNDLLIFSVDRDEGSTEISMRGKDSQVSGYSRTTCKFNLTIDQHETLVRELSKVIESIAITPSGGTVHE